MNRFCIESRWSGCLTVGALGRCSGPMNQAWVASQDRRRGVYLVKN